jgi:hypothetical protein
MERSEAMPIRGSPNGARHPRPQAGRDRPEWVVAINRNGWSQSIVTAGRDHPVRAVLSRKQRATPAVAPIFDGEKEAKLIALACSKPPKGRARWTLRLLENKVVVR